jgi:penicillin-insensitive murein endopeptidase
VGTPKSPDKDKDDRVQKPNDPTQGTKAQVIGFYSEGKMKDSDALPWEGFGFIKILRPRQRHYAAFDLVHVLTWAAEKLQQQYPSKDRLQIGDMSGIHGGPSGGHASHQNGLDADVAFLRLNQTMQDPVDTGGYREKFVRGSSVTQNFDLARNWAYVKILAETGRVQRIFVNQVVKNALCDFAKTRGEFQSETEALRRLRPYAGHEDHFHVRLTCPLNSPDCTPQAEVPVGSGC